MQYLSICKDQRILEGFEVVQVIVLPASQLCHHFVKAECDSFIGHLGIDVEVSADLVEVSLRREDFKEKVICRLIEMVKFLNGEVGFEQKPKKEVFCHRLAFCVGLLHEANRVHLSYYDLDDDRYN